MKRKREPTRVHTRKLDRGVARNKLRKNHATLSKRYNKSFANIWRIISQ